MAKFPTDVKAVFEPGDTVKIILTMNRKTMGEIKTWLNDYSSFAGEPLTDVEAIQALLVVGDQYAEYMDWRDDVQMEKVSLGYDVCIN